LEGISHRSITDVVWVDMITGVEILAQTRWMILIA
jgi:hypothetical protein